MMQTVVKGRNFYVWIEVFPKEFYQLLGVALIVFTVGITLFPEFRKFIQSFEFHGFRVTMVPPASQPAPAAKPEQKPEPQPEPKTAPETPKITDVEPREDLPVIQPKPAAPQIKQAQQTLPSKRKPAPRRYIEEYVLQGDAYEANTIRRWRTCSAFNWNEICNMPKFNRHKIVFRNW